jgi:small GTP-binding protein
MPKEVKEQKVVILGGSGVGKTSLLLRYVEDTFTYEAHTTKVAASYKKIEETKNYTMRLRIWDTMGQEKYSAMGPFYSKGANVIVLVYDVTDPKSWERVKEEYERTIAHSLASISTNKFISQ